MGSFLLRSPISQKVGIDSQIRLSTTTSGSMALHITTADRWETAKASADKLFRHESLQSEGFIHCSTRQQLFGTLNKWFKGTPTVLVLTLDEERVKQVSELRYDDVYPGQPPFPHIYGLFRFFRSSPCSDLNIWLLQPTPENSLVVNTQLTLPGPFPIDAVTKVEEISSDPATGLFNN